MSMLYCSTVVELTVIFTAPWETRELKWHIECVWQQASLENHEPNMFLGIHSTESE